LLFFLEQIPADQRRETPDYDELVGLIEKILEDGVVTKAELKEQREESMQSYKEFIIIIVIVIIIKLFVDPWPSVLGVEGRSSRRGVYTSYYDGQ
jgi:hypothetical protein